MRLKGTNKVETVSKQASSSDEEELLGVYGDMKLGNSEKALFTVRAACILGLDTFIDGSLVKYVIHTYENLSFQMLYMSFLIPDNLNLLKQMIDSYLSRKNPKFLEAAILFQLLTSIQESSNELSTSISHEISKQTLAGFKCEQILTKFWAGCYKGDITQMSRTTFMLYQNLAELSYSWKQLIIRYPYSLPTMREYIKFLNGVGRQHKIAEALLKVHPKLNEPLSANNQAMQTTGADPNSDINIAVLHQSIEDAVDRRPLSSLNQTKARLWFTIILSFIFILSAIILAFVSMHMTSSMSNFLYYSDTTCSLIFHSPNLFEEIVPSGDKGRETFFNHSQVLDDAITNLLQEMPDKILKSNSNLTNQLWNKVEEYSGLETTGIVKFLRLYSYYARSVPFVPEDDNLVLLMKNNTLGIGYSVFLASDAELVSIQNIISELVKYIPIFYGIIWGVMLIIMVPLIFSAMQNVKTELKYIFNLYITIPRSFITELMDPSSTNKITDNKKNMFLQQALASNLNPFDEDEKEPVKAQKEVKGVDNLKLLVHDQSSAGTVIPKYFQLKVWLIVGSITIILLVAATVEVYLFSGFVNDMMIMFKTLQMTARRTTGCSIVLQGILSNFTYLPYSYCSYRLQLTKDFNSKLLLATSGSEVSKKMLTSDAFYSLVHDKACTNESDRACWPFTYMFDYFMILASKAYNSSISEDEIKELVTLYNDFFYPRSYQLHEAGFQFIIYELKNERTILLVIFFVVIFLVSLCSFVFFLPIMKQLDATKESVKLPLKYIPPMRVPDLPKVMQYLQGEADWHRGGIMNETDTRLGNYLNIIEYPHALFEQDKSLLFANPSFYNLIGAPREACIGLSLDAIFSRLINYKNDEKHPFNHILKFFDDNNSIDHSCLRLVTQFERGSHKAKNVEIRMSKILAENDKYIYAMIFEDLSYHDHKEEMMRYERQVAENLKMYALPQQLSNVLTTDGELKSKTFDRAVMASFSLSYATIRDEYDGELADGCSLFMKAAKEVSGVFPNIVKLIHEPPHFVFMQLPDDSDPIDVQTVQGVHFINAIYNSFNSSSNKFKLSTLMLVGQIIVIPMKVKLPVLEAFGNGYKSLILKREKIKNSGKFYVTKETSVYLNDNKSFTLTLDKDLELVSITPKHIDE
ncbi:hypothetical protein TVAG_234990 [Trichomonas vaginalis G3]|uniref:PAS domain-containing protein n=1 Tax=Trichomonas vaginalis (strain ATCC PRA-98 / G3) TaxID=412133 RepID=A2DPL8_TRIV3|nr:hypothetical protein TVAGG3_0935380 [Trichomonas vaginalis G3]EAY17618.1 hypothetical protein TVAG_234990 [Trichomonas vaginalis G3]KAI5486138.1 hypothetical protein TVAGG3_0935380 [Trichomonas vaginalis G3]|eukprot:XP_001329753.1 hypothetical protein [Trichomonas vaginalis G3]